MKTTIGGNLNEIARIKGGTKWMTQLLNYFGKYSTK